MQRVVHLTFPKSGSHWVTDVLSDKEILAYAPWVTFRRCEDDRLSSWAAQRDGFFTGPMFSVTYEEWSQFRGKGDKAIHVMRDPRDHVVSWVFSFSYSHESQPHIQLIRPVLLASDMRRKLMLGMYQFWQSSWIERSWAGKPNTESEYLTTYERIVNDEFGEFKAMLDFLQWPVPDDIIRKVVEQSSFERRSRGRKRGETSNVSHYRRGVAGDWRNYFDRRLGEMFERAVPHMLTELGYEKSDDWYTKLPATVEGLDNYSDDIVATPEVLAQLDLLRTERAEIASHLREQLVTLEKVSEQLAGSS